MKKITLAAALLGSTALAIGVWAQNPGRPEQGGPGQRFGAEMRERMMQRFQQHGGPMMNHGPMQRGPGSEGPGGMDKGDMLKHIVGNPELAKKAGISEDQIKKLKDGQIDFEKKQITMRAEAEVAKLEVKRVMESEKVDRSALEKAIDAAGAKELALRKAGMMRMLDVKESLGAETIEKIKGMIREHMAHRMNQQPGMPGGDRPWLRNRGGQHDGQPQQDAPRPEGRGGERGKI